MPAYQIASSVKAKAISYTSFESALGRSPDSQGFLMNKSMLVKVIVQKLLILTRTLISGKWCWEPLIFI